MPIMIPTPFHLFQHTVTVQNSTWTQENSGTPEYATSQPEPTDVSAFVQPMSPSDSLMYGRNTELKPCRVFMDPLDTDGATYTLKAGDTIAFEGATYRVVETDADLCEVGTLRRCVIELVK